MSDIPMPETLGKREFVKRCLLGAGGIVLGLDRLDAVAGPLLRDLASRDELWRWSKEAMFYESVPGGVQCVKCPHYCFLEEGELGRCRNRLNHGGKLHSIAYGNPCAVHIDPIEKKPLFHFLPSTKAFSIAAAGCNLRCLNCQNWQISQFSPEETRNQDLMPDRVVAQCTETQCESIAYTYSEPTTFYEYTLDTARIARNAGIRNVLKSNGYINKEPLRELCSVVDAANIDLKTFEDEMYEKLAGARLESVLDTLRVLREEGVWLEITNLVVPGWSDDPEETRRMCGWLCDTGLSDAPLHFSRFVPLYKLSHLPPTPVSVLDRAREIALEEGVRYVYIGNVPGHDAQNTCCHHCGKVIVERRGFTILENHLSGGNCGYCGGEIPGVWE
ncbi:MAG: AmmeMemoRadiSam system radical SAM enzyme [Bacteroidota bacterium]